MRAKKVLITAASAGGGHMSNAYSIEAWIRKYYPEVEVEVYDVFKHLPKLFGRDPVSLFYYILSVHAPQLWKWFINHSLRSGNAHAVDKIFVKLSPLLGASAATKKIKLFQPDIIISTYPPIMAPLKRILDRLHRKIPTSLIVTDIFSAPLYWMGGSADHYYVMSENALKQVHLKLPNQKVTLMSPLLHPKFFEVVVSPEKNTLPHVVLLAGGEGVHNLNALAAKLARKNSYKVTVVCGKDAIAFKLLEKQANKEKWKNFQVLGFTKNIEHILADCDCVITKAGPATIFEILHFKKPLICYHYIYGTEEENLHFLENNNYGIYEPDINRIPQLVDKILAKEIRLNTYNFTPDYQPALEEMLTFLPEAQKYTTSANSEHAYEH